VQKIILCSNSVGLHSQKGLNTGFKIVVREIRWHCGLTLHKFRSIHLDFMMAHGNILPLDFKMMVVSPFAMYTTGIGSLPIFVPVKQNMAFGLFHQRQTRIIFFICEGDPVSHKAFYDPGEEYPLTLRELDTTDTRQMWSLIQKGSLSRVVASAVSRFFKRQ